MKNVHEELKTKDKWLCDDTVALCCRLIELKHEDTDVQYFGSNSFFDHRFPDLSPPEHLKENFGKSKPISVSYYFSESHYVAIIYLRDFQTYIHYDPLWKQDEVNSCTLAARKKLQKLDLSVDHTVHICGTQKRDDTKGSDKGFRNCGLFFLHALECLYKNEPIETIDEKWYSLNTGKEVDRAQQATFDADSFREDLQHLLEREFLEKNRFEISSYDHRAVVSKRGAGNDLISSSKKKKIGNQKQELGRGKGLTKSNKRKRNETEEQVEGEENGKDEVDDSKEKAEESKKRKHSECEEDFFNSQNKKSRVESEEEALSSELKKLSLDGGRKFRKVDVQDFSLDDVQEFSEMDDHSTEDDFTEKIPLVATKMKGKSQILYSSNNSTPKNKSSKTSFFSTVVEILDDSIESENIEDTSESD